jgi:Glyoxalase-like domain
MLRYRILQRWRFQMSVEFRGILFWRVPEPKTTKSRMHVDLGSKEPQSEIDRFIGLGSQKVEYREGHGTGWTVVLDPEGNEFCIG